MGTPSTKEKKEKIMKKLLAILSLPFLFLSLSAIAQTAQTVASSSNKLVNADVISMVKAGLDERVIVAKIKHSPVSFDVSTDGLIGLQKAHVPPYIVTVMIERPSGPPLSIKSSQNESSAQSPKEVKKATSLKEVKKVWIKADSEVLRETIRQKLKALGGPMVASRESDAEATFSFATDCGAQTISMWSGANYCTCEGSLTIEAADKQLWSDLEHERSANASKASKKLAVRMTKDFVREWLKVRGK